MRTYKTEGIILRRRNIGEYDRIVTVFTKQFGKIQVKAPGVRKITSRRCAHIEPLNKSLLTLYKGKNVIPLLTEAQTIESFQNVKEDLTKVGFSYHICELINELCPENQENYRVYDLFVDTLATLGTEDNPSDLIYLFEVELLKHLGFYNNSAFQINPSSFVEQILEKRLKTKQLLPRFL